MKYIKINQHNIVTGCGNSATDDIDQIATLPGETVIPNVDAPPGFSTVYRYADGQIIDTGQPLLQPASGWAWSDTAVAWYDARNLEQVKADKWEQIKASRADAEYGGFTWDGSTFDSNLASQQKIMGAVQLAQLNPAFEIDWTLADNTVRTLDATDMQAAGVALGGHVNTQYVHARTLRQQIDEAATQAEVEAVVW
jgi:hypothetical protein